MTGVLAARNVRAAAEAPPRPAPACDLSVELRDDLVLSSVDRASLDALIDAHPHSGVFSSPAWLSGFFAEPPPGSTPALLVCREAGTIRAVAPLSVRGRRGTAHIGLLGGAAGSDRVDLVAARGYEAAASDAFLRWLADAYGARGWTLALRDVPADSALWGAIERANGGPAPAPIVEPREVHTLPYLDLIEAGAGGAGRHSPSLAKHRRWLERRCRLRIERLDAVADVLTAFESLRRFLHARWRDRAEGSALDDPAAVRFHRRVLPLLLAEGRLRMIRLVADARTIAVFYGLASGGWWGYYLAGYDREWAGRIHLGQITLAAAMDLAAAEGALEFDFLKGAERVKYLWPVRERSTLDADLYSEHAGAQLTRALRAGRGVLAAMAKSARRLF